MSAILRVSGPDEDRSIRLSYDADMNAPLKKAKTFDTLRVRPAGMGLDLVVFSRSRSGKRTWISGRKDAHGNISWHDVLLPNRRTISPPYVSEYVDRFSSAIDYLLERYFARMEPGTYVVNDPPRVNPARANPLRAMWLPRYR